MVARSSSCSRWAGSFGGASGSWYVICSCGVLLWKLIVPLGTGVDVNGFPILARLSASATDQLWSRVDPQRPSLDWRVNKPPRVSSLVNARAALGQLIGHEAPSGAACVPCSRGNGPFVSCRIVFLPSSGFQWSLACACCQYSGAANKCSLLEFPSEPILVRSVANVSRCLRRFLRYTPLGV